MNESTERLHRFRRLSWAIFTLGFLGAGLAVALLASRPESEVRPDSLPHAGAAAPVPRAIPVEIVRVKATTFRLPVPATGTILPKESVQIVSELPRRLVRIRAGEGEQVQKGAVLFELDSADLVAERARLSTQKELATRNVQRQRELLAEAITTATEADAAETLVKDLDAQSRLLDITIQKTSIRAPFDGVLGLRRVSEGAWVNSSTVLTTLEDRSELKIDFKVPERHASTIRVGDSFRIQLESKATEFDGQVIATEPSVDTTSRSLTVRGRIANHEALIPGTFAKVELPVNFDNALLIPAIAVLPSVDGRSVFVERENTARLVAVEIGARDADRLQVVRGLEPGDSLIVSNLLRLRDGTPVQVIGTP